MAKRKIDLFIEINNEKDFEQALRNNASNLICAEIYCNFVGSCAALDNLFNTIKFDWSSGMLVLLRVSADEIESLERFRDHSEPVYMFILNHRVTKVFRGVDCLRLGEAAKRELKAFNDIQKGLEVNRPTYDIHEATLEEAEWIQKKAMANQVEYQMYSAKRALRQAARKRHRAERMVPYLTTINFVLFWPHCFHAHPQLYERWDENKNVKKPKRVRLAGDETGLGDCPCSKNTKAVAFRYLLNKIPEAEVENMWKEVLEVFKKYSETK